MRDLPQGNSEPCQCEKMAAELDKAKRDTQALCRNKEERDDNKPITELQDVPMGGQ
jgi:hypothetical protein